MKLSVLLASYLFTIFYAHAQVKHIIVTSTDDNKSVSNVLIYNKTDIIGETDKKGKVTLKLKNVDTVVLVKNGYHDLVLPISQLTDNVKMTKNGVIVLNEIKITPINAKILLARVDEFMKGKNEDSGNNPKSNYLIPTYMQIYNKFTANNDTLHYLNERFLVEKNRLKVNFQNKNIKGFKRVKKDENIYSSYNWKSKEINFDVISPQTPLGMQYSTEFTNFFFHQDLFEYLIQEDDKYYKLNFKQKKKSFSSIEGYLLIDKYDYGIYEFETKLLNDKPLLKKGTNFSTKRALSFKIINDGYRFSNLKQNGKYVLDNCTKNITFTIEGAEFDNILFSNTVQVEKTMKFDDTNLKQFDTFSWDIK
ncbi:hypothetical protein [Pedobacter sp. SL55]|uniref:hypothetical protein n=1 Tax=Pedobacter sp. SL55 TaxID=2995161 RepID=UPI0022721ECA|nr:hypothetical protein [Pedobacter sp. SL55]WAC41528.1 hypothetical protein OVA16_03970 [Pedobacter sp. SL55]